MRTSLTLLALVALAFPPALADCTPSTTTPMVTSPTCDPAVGGSVPCLYVNNDLCQLDCIGGFTIYQETNGIPGEQRGDEIADDTCGGMIAPDAIFFQ